MPDIELEVVDETPVVELEVIEGKVKPEIVGQVTPAYEPQSVTPPAGSVFSAVEVGAIPDPTEEETYTENGRYDVTRIGTAIVQVPQGVFPTGTLPITRNGIADVTNYAAVNVAVPIVFDMELLTLELLTVTVADNFNGVLNGALGALAALAPDGYLSDAVNLDGFVYAALVDEPDTADQLVAWGAHYHSGVRTIGRKYDGTKTVIQNNPAVNSWAAKLKAGTRYKLAWMRYD